MKLLEILGALCCAALVYALIVLLFALERV